MQTQKTAERSAGGMDQRFVADANSASFILNMRVDDEGLGWVRDRGWEPYSPPAGFSRVVRSSEVAPVDSLAVYTRNRGAEVYAIYEQGGTLFYEHGISSTTPERQVLDSGRAVPSVDDPGTQYVQHGRDLYIVNGQDSPLRFRGDKRVRLFGFARAPAAPDVFEPDPDYFKSVTTPRNTSGTISLDLGRPLGLGDRDTAVDTQTRYLYRLAWETETGSVSPLSAAAAAEWEWDNTAEQGGYAVGLRELDQGPAGVVAIRIYRTKSLVNVATQGEATYYLVDRIPVGSTDYMDIIPDSQLVEPAPALTDSTVLPQTVRFIESWDGRMWAAGGAGNELRVIYSGDGPEQFPAFNFFDIGVREGGAVTGIKGYLGALLVFRERAVDIITPVEAGTRYRLSRLSPDVGTIATNTIRVVPGVGVMFLTYDGVRVVAGQGTQMQMSRQSRKVSRELGRLNRGAMARATASWSPREREWWCHYPADGNAEPCRGIVYHRDKDAWSVRAAVSTSSPGAFLFNCLATLPSGEFIIGPRPVDTSLLPLSTTTIWNRGLQVWSACGIEGISVGGTVIDGEIFNANVVVDGVPVTGQWSSMWEDFGSDIVKKSVREVLLEGVTVGHNDLTLEYATDWTETYTSAGTQTASLSSVYKGPSEAARYALTAPGPSGTAIIGTSAWTSEKVTRLRWDIATPAIGQFKWRITGTTRFFVLRYRVSYIPRKRSVIKQGAR